MEYVPISGITVGERTRKELGDLSALAESMRERGMIHPIAVDDARKLVAGYRRLKAAEKLGWDKVPVVVTKHLKEAADYLKAERDENTQRKPFTKTEMVEMGRRLEALVKPAAESRQQEGRKAGGRGRRKADDTTESDGGPNGEASVEMLGGKLPPSISEKTREVVAAAVGVSGRTYEKAKQVVEAAEADPERNGDLPAAMDANGVDPAHKELRRRATAPAALKDQVGNVVPDRLREIFADGPAAFAEIRKLLRHAQDLIAALADAPAGAWYRKELARTVKGERVRFRCQELDNALRILNHNEPYTAICPYCHSKTPGEVDRGCKGCKGLGWGPKNLLDRAPDDYRVAVVSAAGGGTGA